MNRGAGLFTGRALVELEITDIKQSQQEQPQSRSREV